MKKILKYTPMKLIFITDLPFRHFEITNSEGKNIGSATSY